MLAIEEEQIALQLLAWGRVVNADGYKIDILMDLSSTLAYSFHPPADPSQCSRQSEQCMVSQSR